MMDTTIIGDLDRQICCAQETLAICNSIREKVSRLESEKNEALEKCKQLEAKIDRLKEEKCSNCTFLLTKLNKERMEKEKLKKEEKAKLLKTIAKTLESLDDGVTNHLTNAQQLFTQLVFDGFEESNEKKKISLIEDNESGDDSSKGFADETVIAIESEDSSSDCNYNCGLLVSPVTVPETELQGFSKRKVKQSLKTLKQPDQVDQGPCIEENIKPEGECEIRQLGKKRRCERQSADNGIINSSKPFTTSVIKQANSLLKNNNKTASVLTAETVKTGSTEEQSASWKMKPSLLVDGNAGAPSGSGKRMKQMTLSLTRPEKKHDISLSEKFKGGITRNNILPVDEEKDVILPSPERILKKIFSKKVEPCETLEDPDLTMFQPGAASTCHPLETSFDKIPEPEKSPPYKYRRDTVRGKEKRMKLPGQDCNECAEYYKAAGLDKTQDLQARMNGCSRHRDKYQIRPQTPPGFWDPVLPVTPQGSQEDS